MSCKQSGKNSLGDELYRTLAAESATVDEIFVSLKLRSEHAALETVNKLESAIFAWKEKITEQASNGKSPARTPWSFAKDPSADAGRNESLLNRAEALRNQIKSKYPNLPQSFLDATKIQYGKVKTELHLHISFFLYTMQSIIFPCSVSRTSVMRFLKPIQER